MQPFSSPMTMKEKCRFETLARVLTWRGGGSKANSEVAVQSPLVMTCHTMRWLRSALGCSFTVCSTPSAASPSSSPGDTSITTQLHLWKVTPKALFLLDTVLNTAEDREDLLILYTFKYQTQPFVLSYSALTHPEVYVTFSAAHHQRGLGSFLRRGVCRLVARCFSSARRRQIGMT